MWCSEQAVGEDVVPLLLRAGIEWTISDQTVLSSFRCRCGSRVPRRPAAAAIRLRAGRLRAPVAYVPYLLRREAGREMAIVFRDHTLSDLIGFGYQSWDSRDAANDLLSRIRAIRGATVGAIAPGQRPAGANARRSSPSRSTARTPGSTTRTMAGTSSTTSTRGWRPTRASAA